MKQAVLHQINAILKQPSAGLANYLPGKYSTDLQLQALADSMDAFLADFCCSSNDTAAREGLLCCKVPSERMNFTVKLSQLNFREGLHLNNAP